MTMSAPVTAPQVWPVRAMPAPKAPATRNAVSRSRPDRPPYADRIAWAQEKPFENSVKACPVAVCLFLCMSSPFLAATKEVSHREDRRTAKKGPRLLLAGEP
jgi:hypothetical protein